MNFKALWVHWITPAATSCVLGLYFASNAVAIDPIPGPIPAEIRRTYDADTYTQVIAHVWPGVYVNTSVRIDGIDTPEIRGKCEKEKRMAIEARDFLISISKKTVFLRNVRWGKYAGRVLADVEIPGVGDVRAILIKAGMARPYTGGKRQGWCD